MRRANKNVISLAVVLIFGLSLLPTSYADPISIVVGGMGGLSGAGLFGSLAGAAGVDIGWSNSDNLDAMWNVLNPDHIYFSSDADTETKPDPQTQVPTVYDYITLDATGLHDAMMDNIKAFVDDNNVTDNSSGSISQPKHYKGYSLYNSLNGYSYGASIGAIGVGSFGVADISLVITDPGSQYSYYNYAVTYPGGSHTGTKLKSDTGKQIYFGQYYNDTPKFLYMDSGGLYSLSKGVVVTITNGTNVPWTSGTVNTNVFDGYTRGAKISIPRSISGLTDGFTPQDFLTSINDVWSRGLKNQIQIEENELPPVPPTPPIPIPTTPIGDVPFEEFVDLWGNTITSNQIETNDKLDFIGSNGEDQLEELEDVNTALTEMNGAVSSIDDGITDLNDSVTHIDAGVTYILQDTDSIDTNVGSIEEHTDNIDTNIDSLVDTADNIDTNLTSIESLTGSIDTNVDDIADTAESIDTNIGIGNGILGGIRSLAQSAVNYLEGIAEHVAELVEEIVEGTETLIAGILNQIPQAFSVIFGPIKQASSIWHYVVEWITSIGAPFQFIWSMASGTSYYIILPVYASLAAAVVLAFFKRFGR